MKIELWSDEKLSEFALKSGPEFIVKTSECVDMVNMIDQFNCEAGFNYDWRYTLSQWVVYYISNKFVVNMKEKGKTTLHQKPELSAMPILIRPISRKKRTAKPELKCHYCHLKYCLEKERKAHEEFWHANKMPKT